MAVLLLGSCSDPGVVLPQRLDDPEWPLGANQERTIVVHADDDWPMPEPEQHHHDDNGDADENGMVASSSGGRDTQRGEEDTEEAHREERLIEYDDDRERKNAGGGDASGGVRQRKATAATTSTDDDENDFGKTKEYLYRQPVCRTCRIWRPPRSSHCIACDVCVEEYDHHCGVVGSCVAKRTFRFFTLFFYLLQILCFFVCARSIHVAAVHLDWSGGIKTDGGRWKIVATLGCIVVPGMTGCFIGYMSYLYTRYACKGLTQKDEVGKRLKNHGHPWGCGRCLRRLFSCRQPSRFGKEELEDYDKDHPVELTEEQEAVAAAVV